MPIDWDGWPLVTVQAADRPIDEGRALLLDALEEAVTQAEEFVVVVVLPERVERDRSKDGRGAEAPAGPPARGVVRRLRAIRSGMRARCQGIAFVISPEVAARAGKVVRAGSVIMGCPTTAVDGVAAGRRWAVERLDHGDRRATGGPR